MAFRPFFTTKQATRRRGSGLGLTIARRMAERAGAHLTLANADGGGLEATLTFEA